MKTKDFLHKVMSLAWGFVKRNGLSMSEALKRAWANMKLKIKMKTGIVKFYFQKVDGSAREAWGTLSEKIVPETKGNDTRKKNETIQIFYDTEKSEWRSFKKANLLSIA